MKRIHLAIIAVVVVVVLVIAGAALAGAFDSIPKKAILKVQDIESITNVHGNWTQVELHTFENSSLPYGANQAAFSGVRFESDFSGYSFAFTVAKMTSAEEADKQYLRFIFQGTFQNVSSWNQTPLNNIGDGGVMFTTPDGISPLIGCWAIFHKGAYLVTMLGVGDASILPSTMLRLAEAQSDRLP